MDGSIFLVRAKASTAIARLVGLHLGVLLFVGCQANTSAESTASLPGQFVASRLIVVNETGKRLTDVTIVVPGSSIKYLIGDIEVDGHTGYFSVDGLFPAVFTSAIVDGERVGPEYRDLSGYQELPIGAYSLSLVFVSSSSRRAFNTRLIDGSADEATAKWHMIGSQSGPTNSGFAEE